MTDDTEEKLACVCHRVDVLLTCHDIYRTRGFMNVNTHKVHGWPFSLVGLQNVNCTFRVILMTLDTYCISSERDRSVNIKSAFMYFANYSHYLLCPLFMH